MDNNSVKDKFIVPELSERIEAEIVDSFDLGYILKSPEGKELQLRITEMDKKLLYLHDEGEDKEIIGSKLYVYLFKDYPHRVSQLSQLSLKLRLERNRKKMDEMVDKLNNFVDDGEH